MTVRSIAGVGFRVFGTVLMVYAVLALLESLNFAFFGITVFYETSRLEDYFKGYIALLLMLPYPAVYFFAARFCFKASRKYLGVDDKKPDDAGEADDDGSDDEVDSDTDSEPEVESAADFDSEALETEVTLEDVCFGREILLKYAFLIFGVYLVVKALSSVPELVYHYMAYTQLEYLYYAFWSKAVSTVLLLLCGLFIIGCPNIFTRFALRLGSIEPKLFKNAFNPEEDEDEDETGDSDDHGGEDEEEGDDE